MAVIYIPDSLSIAAHTHANRDHPHSSIKDAMERRNRLIKTAINEKIERETCGSGDDAGT